MDERLPAPLPPGQRDAWPGFLRAFGWIGVDSFGGPVAQLGVMQREAVRRGWLSDAAFLRVVAFANILPGPEALEACIHLGWLRRGRLGGVVAGLLFVWPGVAAMLLLGAIYRGYGAHPLLEGVLGAIRPAAAGLIAAAMWRLGRRSVTTWPALLVALAAFVVTVAAHAPFLAVIAGGALLGAGLPRAPAAPRRLKVALVAAAAGVVAWAAVIVPRDLSPRAGAQAQHGVAVAARPGEIVTLSLGTALMTFGGAYTALPYLRERAVVKHGWLDDAQIAQALAMTEAAPGPLISVTVLVVYMASDVPGALLAALCLFAPCFLLVLLLAPLAHRLDASPRLARSLAGVSAATLGLVAALSAGLAPRVLHGPEDLAIAAVALVCAVRVKAVWVVLACALFGLVRSTVHI